VRIAEAALKRGYSIEQIEHAVVHHIDEFRDQGNESLVMLIGPTQTGELLEVGVVLAKDDVTIDIVAHVMAVRPKYLRRKKRR
jgi:hypothetical protein